MGDHNGPPEPPDQPLIAEIEAAVKSTSREKKVGSALAPTAANIRLVDEMKWQDFLRDEIRRLLTSFYWLNGGVYCLVVLLWLGQTLLVKDQSHPVVTEHVLLSLIAATAAQLGALAFAAALTAIKRGASRQR